MDDGTQENPFDSLDDVPDLEDQIRIGLERGSVFRDGYLSGAPTNATVATYGVGEPPLIDLSDRVDTSAWTAVDDATNVYRVEVPVPTFRNIPENEVQEQLYENGTELPAQDTVTAVVATPGSFFLDQSAAPWKLYYHPTDSTDPREDQKTVAYAARPIGINLSGIGVSGEGGRIAGVRIRRPLGYRGCASVGPGGTIERCIFYEGGKHHTVHPGGTVKDTIFARSTVNRRRVFASACVWFQGKGVDEKQPVDMEYVVLRNLRAMPLDHHTQGAGWSAPSTVTGLVLWKTPHPGELPGPLEVDGGYSYHSRGGLVRVGEKGGTYRRLLIDGLGEEKGADLIETDCTIEDSVIVDEMVSRNSVPDRTVTVRNCVIVGTFFQVQNENTPILRFENCVFLALTGQPIKGTIDIHSESDHCLFFSGSAAQEVHLVDGTSLSELQADTGAFGNSAWLTGGQFESLYPRWRRGDFRIPADTRVTHADGTVSTQFPDGTPIQSVGPQTHWDWANRAVANGPPSQWPTPPRSEEEDSEYSQNPQGWIWNGSPVDHRAEVSLSEEMVAFWPMEGEAGEMEPDRIGENPLDTVGGEPGAGSASNWSYRSFDGDDDYLQPDVPTEALSDFPGLWVSLPVRPEGDPSGEQLIHGRVAGSRGVQLRWMSDGALSVQVFLGHKGPRISVSTSSAVSTGRWWIVQFWYSRARGRVGIRCNDEEEAVVYGAHRTFVNTVSKKSFALGAKNSGGRHFEGDIGPVMITTIAPQPEDRDWVYNAGAYRSLAEFENYSIEVLDI
jgi:hypothetical protein